MPRHQSKTIGLIPQQRLLQVLRSEVLGPHLRRVVFGGEALAGFDAPGADDHVTLFFPNAQGRFVLPEPTADGPRWPEGALPSPARDFTARAFDAEANELVIDFVLHDGGVASNWARRARAGDALVAEGPRGSFVPADDFDTYVLIGDESALPAIARWLEALPGQACAQVYIEVPEEADRQPLYSDADVQVWWLERNGFDAAGSTLLEDVLRDFEEPDGDTFYWIAAESGRARAMGQFLEEYLEVPGDWIRASGYWDAGTAD